MTPRRTARPAFSVVGMQGHYTRETKERIPELWGHFVSRLASIPDRRGAETYGVCRLTKFPGTSDPALEYTACVEVAAPGTVPAGMVGFTIPASSYAVFTHEGHISGIGKTWDAIFEAGLPATGLEHADTADFEVYDQRWDPRTGEGPVDIWIAVRK